MAAAARGLGAFAVALGLLLGARASADPGRVVVGSKVFTESRVLAEMMALLLETRTELEVERRLGLGGTLICLAALQEGEIDVYPDYTGTGWSIVLQEPGRPQSPMHAFVRVRREFERRFDITWLSPFGLNNTYALVMREDRAKALGVTRVSELVPIADQLSAGVSLEFLNREDGYPGLKAAYGLEFGSIRGMDHGLAYEALHKGVIDVVDAYSTDGKLLRYPLVLLEDDRQFFPPYHAAPLVRRELLRAHPEVEAVIEELAFRIGSETMQKLNFRVESEGATFRQAAREFLEAEGLLAAAEDSTLGRELVARDELSFFALAWRRRAETLQLGLQHIVLTAISVFIAALFAIPLGIAITRRPTLQRVVLGAAGIIQTIPSLALLAFMIPIPGLGLGVNAAIAALSLYALLPILRNTFTGIVGVDPTLVEAAQGLGLTDRQVLTHVQLPLAARTIMAGVRTSTVISVGVATLAAFIGAGGLGEPIVTGLQLNDANLILTGAVPAALLAIVVDFGLGALERALGPRGVG